MTLPVLRLYSVDDGIINECGAVIGMKIAGVAKVLGENPLYFHFFRYKYKMT
jgi:hypothetical protein